MERFLFITGGAYLPEAIDFLARWPHPLLEKPFMVDQVLAAVEAVLVRGRERYPVG